jgi:hypothetical protein
LINYQMNLADSPEWYRIVWVLHQRNYKKATDDCIVRLLDRYYENSGKRVEIPDCDELVSGIFWAKYTYTHHYSRLLGNLPSNYNKKFMKVDMQIIA